MFEKEHADVLKAIRNIVIIGDFNIGIFAEIEYVDSKICTSCYGFYRRIRNCTNKKPCKLFASSRMLQESLKKEHKNVLRDIRNTATDEDLDRLNFELVEYRDNKSKKML